MKTTWDCVYFGNYPQKEVVSTKQQSGVYGKVWSTDDDYIVYDALYNVLNAPNSTAWNSKNEIALRGIKYRRMKKSDATNVSENPGDSHYYNWSNDSNYHFFEYEPIKWRVLNVEGNKVLLLADKVLDNQSYNTVPYDGSWEFSEMRSWLNGYGSDANATGIDYTGNNPGENTMDKVFVLAESDVSYDEAEVDIPGYDNKALRYGFPEAWNDFISESRISYSSTIAKAMGVGAWDVTGFCNWRLRTIGPSEENIMHVGFDGYVSREGTFYLSDRDLGCRPALYLDLSSTNLWTYAGTVCSDGTMNEVGGNGSSEPTEPHTHIWDSGTITTPATCRLKGVKTYTCTDVSCGETKTEEITASDITRTYSTVPQSFKIGAKCKGGAKLTYSSNNSNITVNSVGRVTVKAKYMGQAVITITSSATAKYKAAMKQITITVPPKKISISKVTSPKIKNKSYLEEE